MSNRLFTICPDNKSMQDARDLLLYLLKKDTSDNVEPSELIKLFQIIVCAQGLLSELLFCSGIYIKSINFERDLISIRAAQI